MLRRADGLVIAVLLAAALLAWAGVSILKTRAERAVRKMESAKR